MNRPQRRPTLARQRTWPAALMCSKFVTVSRAGHAADACPLGGHYPPRRREGLASMGAFRSGVEPANGCSPSGSAFGVFLGLVGIVLGVLGMVAK